MYKTPLRIFVVGINKKSIKIHPIIMTDADYDYILDEIDLSEKLSLKEMWVLIVMMNCIDYNNNNAIFNVVLNYIIIKNWICKFNMDLHLFLCV